MKNKTILHAAIPGAIALAAILLSFRAPVSADAILGYASVVTLVGVGAMEYRLNWRRLIGR